MDIKVVGYILSTSFHKTKFIVVNLVKQCPGLINKHIIKGVMDVEWARCLWKLNQNLGNMNHQDTVAVFVNKKYIGTYKELQEYLSTKYNFIINLWPLNYHKLIPIDVQNYYNKNKFTFVRMAFEVNNWEIGHVVFALFDKLVPETCKYFIQLCQNKTEGYLNSFVHRIDTNNGFIQAGRNSNQMPYLKKENYTVKHDRRGVLSLAGRREHFNGPEFVISLEPNPWMNNKYVAFGHAIEGERTLRSIEGLSNAHGNPADRLKIRITACDRLPPLRSADAGLETFLRSTVQKKFLEALHARVYGEPEPLRFVADFRCAKQVVDAAIGNAVCKIRRLSRATGNAASQTGRAGTGVPSPELVGSGTDAGGSIGDRRAPIAGSRADRRARTAGPGRFSERDAAGFNDVPGPDRTMTAETDDGVDKTGSCGPRLPRNHRDYWKHKKLYESIVG